MKTIWIDGYEANVPQRLGSGQVAFELIKNLEKIDKENDYTILLPNLPLDDLPKIRAKFKYKILKPKRFWTRIALPLELFKSSIKPDIFFSPNHYLPRFVPKKVKKIVTIFDLSFLYYPEMFNKGDFYKLKNWTKDSILRTEHIITISNFTKKDIVKNYHINGNKITVACPGYNSELFKPVESEEKIKSVRYKYGIDSDYIIYVGTIQPRKNLSKLIETFKDIADLKLVIVGKTKGLGRLGWKYEEILELPKKLNIEKKVIFTGYIADGELNYLLNGALAFCLPSLYEGFGIPVLDAMSVGVPVIVSNRSSLPEVVGDAGLLIDPGSVEDIKDKILKIKSNKSLRDKLIKKGLKRVKGFSWEKMAKEVKKIFLQI